MEILFPEWAENETLIAFDDLVSFGLKIVPIRPLSKAPIRSGWLDWKYRKARRLIELNPGCNIGLLLGTVVDIEGDSPWANRHVNRLIGGTSHPAYVSSKSVHHLFLSPDPDLRRLVWRGIEFRGHGHQSVLPPSVVGTTAYRWLSPITGPIPEMPRALVSFLKGVSPRPRDRRKPGHTSVPCPACSTSKFIHRKRFTLEVSVFRSLGLVWMCQGCRPLDVRENCRRLRRMNRIA